MTAARRVGVGALVAAGLLTAAVASGAASSGGGRAGRTWDRGPGLEKVADELAARERSVERRERSAADRERELRALEDGLVKRAAELEATRAEIASLLAEVDAEHERKVAAIVQQVQAMKPAAAAPMVAALDRELAVAVLSRMSPAKAGKLLAALPAPLAADLTEASAGPTGPVPVPAPPAGP